MKDQKKPLKFATRAIHGGQAPDPTTGSVMPPIYATSTYVQQSPGVNSGYEYARSKNPTRESYERCAADLENGVEGFAFASGMAAIATILELLDAGDHIVSADDIYGGTLRLFDKVRTRSAGLQITYVDMSDLDALAASITPNTRMLWLETPSNPMMKLLDLQGIAEIAKGKNLLTVVDNTFASPWIQRPLDFGHDIVMHSATKYLGGHSDALGGVVVVKDQELAKDLRFLQASVGSIPSAFDCFLILRGIKTLPVRMACQSQNAEKIAHWLEKHPAVEKVLYPGLESHPQHELAKAQMASFGAMISVVIKGGEKKARKFLENTQLFQLAESLGGVESLINHPATMTHGSMPEEAKRAIGMTDDLVRLSVGIEDADDLIGDLERALVTLV
ncbi:MAG: cystathionine gamma-synthase [Pseudomonadota bacterium]